MLLTLKNKIVLGTVQFGINYGISNSTGKTSVEEVSKILDMACQKGVSMLDTAQAYGSSEEILGKLHQNRFSIVTKLNSRLLNKQSATSLVEESLKKLKVESIHGVLFHSLINSSKDQQAFDELVHLKKKGIIRKVGLSANTLSDLENYTSKFGKPDLLQIPYNIVDKRFEKISIDLHKEGVEIHSRSTFLQGLFFMEISKLSNHFEEVKPFIVKLQNQFREHEELARFLLTTVLEKNFIDKVVIGVNNSAQLLSNLSNMKLQTDFLNKNAPPKLSDNILNPSLWSKN
jgi:aryl-alcohol dehydrogenase-like predicted oxidoreductase